MTLEALKTFTTRYSGHDGRERAVMLMEHYEELLRLAERGCHHHHPPWQAFPEENRCDIPIGREGSEDAPITVHGKYLKHPKEMAFKIARLLNESEE